MIDKSEIMDFSRKFGLRANVIEKDYVLGWVLAGIFNHPVIGSCFNEIAQWVYNEAGIEIPQDLIRFDVYQNNRGFMSAQGRIGYRGPMQPRGDLPRIKLDLTADEIMVLDPVARGVHHPYSDLPAIGIRIKSYCFEEVFAEKIRALAERERPRDLYDVGRWSPKTGQCDKL